MEVKARDPARDYHPLEFFKMRNQHCFSLKVSLTIPLKSPWLLDGIYFNTDVLAVYGSLL